MPQLCAKRSRETQRGDGLPKVSPVVVENREHVQKLELQFETLNPMCNY
jgi:hypothetical protein